jgi:AraC-like DNA-binding protein
MEDIRRPHRKEIAVNMVSSLLLEIDAIFEMRHVRVEKTFSRKEHVNNHFLNLLSHHFLQERTVMFYAELLNITPKYLTEVTKEITGKTAGELIDDRVILEAKVLLKNVDLPIKQIADILNFSDQFFFSKYFKNFTGFSPSAYRNNDK